VLCAGAIMLASGFAAAAGQLKSQVNPFLVPPWMGTWSQLYLDAAEAREASRRAGVVFVDVRFTAELRRDGAPAGLDGHIPWMNMAPVKIGSMTVYQPRINRNFLGDLKRLVARRGGVLGRTPVVLISTTGERSAKAADFLNENGYGEVYTVVYGFTGGDHPDDQAQSWKGMGLPRTTKVANAFLYKGG
jgi:rhodanese-related sulfurtransferase